MKKTISLLFIAFFFISCFNNKSGSPTSGQETKKNNYLTENIVKYYFDNIVENTKERTEFIGTSLKKDREFMLSVYLQDYFSASVLSSAEKYTSPKINYCKVGFLSEGEFYPLSEFGENRSFEAYEKEFSVISDSLWTILRYDDSGIYITAATLVKNKDFENLKNILFGSEILVLYNSTVVNSTLELDGKPAVLNSDTDSLSINGKKFGFQTIIVTDEINVLVLMQ
ncbi:MAG: hypothetical protein LBH98_06545 [Chitinispirillales bacterium]|jgi:hypothetical protein|nr:hypothetical protein [Chitinispirillales bacterium]